MTFRKIIHAPFKSELGIFIFLLLSLAALLGYMGGLGQIDRFIYDKLIKLSNHSSSNKIVIIAIDDISVASIGRWPWPRRTHARLLDILGTAEAKAIGMDIIFSESSAISGNDALLATAIKKNGRIVLPVLIERTTGDMKSVLPLPAFQNAAKSLGHIHMTFDEDGIVRSVYQQKYLNGIAWPQFALAVFHAGLPDDLTKNGIPDVSEAAVDSGKADRTSLSHVFRNANLERIPFSSMPGQFSTVSYLDVLNGLVPADFFKDKYVLIGATAAGIASTFATPVTTDHHAMSGVEINSNILSALIEGRSIQNAARWLEMLFAMCATFLAILICRYYSPFLALGLTALLAVMTGLTAYCIFQIGIWLPPAAAILMVIGVYPLWSWRKLDATIKFLSEEIKILNKASSVVLRDAGEAAEPDTSDFLDKRIINTRLAANRSRDMHQFVIDNLNSMPDATLVLSKNGDLLMVNQLAQKYFASLGIEASCLPKLDTIFEKFECYFETNARRPGWREVLLQLTDTDIPLEIETRDVNLREFLIKSTQSRRSDRSMQGWIVSLVDITSLRAAERRREESLNFISHDMRVPQSSILALIQLQKNPATAFPLSEFLGRIEKSVETTLNLADNFVHLAKAESQAYQLQEADFPSILADAADDMWAFAHSKSIAIVLNAEVENYWLHVDRSLMVRAIGNLISNAIKFSPSGSQVVCTARPTQKSSGDIAICTIADQGKGIDISAQSSIFSPFQRANEHGRDGVGLGLAFVKMVVERHGGTVDVHSTVGKGSVFTLTLPCMIDTGKIEHDA